MFTTTTALKVTKRSLYIQHLTFHAIGIDITSIERTIKNPLLLWLPFLCTIVIITANGCYILENLQDIDKLAGALAPFIEFCLSTWKVLMFLFKRKAMVKLVRHIYATTLQATAAQEIKIIECENYKDKLFSLSYYISCIILGTFAACTPLATTVVVFCHTGKFKFYETFKTSFPFDQHQPFNYFIVSLLTVATIYFTGHCSVAVDTLYSWFVFNIAAQFRILQLRVKQAANIMEDPLHMELAIHKCLACHQATIAMADEFHLAFRHIIFVEFLTNCLQLCFIAYQLGSGISMEYIPFLVAFLAAVFAQLSMYCYGGQRLQDESELIASYINDSFKWHSIAPHLQKLLILPTLRARKPCQLSGIFFTVDWSLFIWVVRTNASYITMLWTLDDN